VLEFTEGIKAEHEERGKVLNAINQELKMQG
jgi:hypothetical protein